MHGHLLQMLGYVTCTAHFINQQTWTLHSIVMGLFGGSTADVVIDYCENQLICLPFLTVKLQYYLNLLLGDCILFNQQSLHPFST